MRVSLFDNWLIWLYSYIQPGGAFYHHEFVDPRLSLRRGLGLCGQQALTLVGLLAERGFEVGRLRLRGHMATWVSIDGKEIIADPDFGLVLNFDLETAEADVVRVREIYDSQATQRFSTPETKAAVFNTIVATYAGNNRRAGPGLANSAGGAAFVVEKCLYVAKWIVPFLLIAVSICFWRNDKVLVRT